MRSKLALAGVVAGAAAFLAPVTPASAYCQQPVIVIEEQGSGECTNGCMETGEAYEAVRLALTERVAAAGHIPGYWDLFVCPM